MRFSFFIALILLLQGSPARGAGNNAVSAEVSGRGGLFSINYDTAFLGSLYLGLGLSHWRTATATESVSVTIVPIYANYYFMESLHRVFASFAVDLVNASGAFNAYGFSGTSVLFLPGIGYEYRDDNGLLFRATFYYFLNNAFTTGGFSAGYNF